MLTELNLHSLRQKCFAIMCISETVTSQINHANTFFPLPILCREEMTHTVIRVQLFFHSVLVYEVGWKQGQGLRRRLPLNNPALPCFSSFHCHLSGLRNKAIPGAHYHLAKGPREPFKDLEGCLFFFLFFFSPVSLFLFISFATLPKLSLSASLYLSLPLIFSSQSLYSNFWNSTFFHAHYGKNQPG